MKRGTTLWTVMIAILLMVSSLTACNTVKGVGKDIESGGKAIQKAAN